VCGTPVREGPSVYTCETGRACAFVVFKTMAKRKISARMVRQLLKDGRSETVKGFRSKAGNEFEAALEWREGKVAFVFPPREERPAGEGGPREGGAERGGGRDRVGDSRGGAERGGGAAAGRATDEDRSGGRKARTRPARASRAESGEEGTPARRARRVRSGEASPAERTPLGPPHGAPQGPPRDPPPDTPRERASARPRESGSSRPTSPVGLACPRCGVGRTVKGRTAWGCDRWREGCGFILPFVESGVPLSDAAAVDRILRGP
jgi:hypothetical protein